ncbi:MAG: hypothetical protein ABIO46_12405 [Chitinophagales bacterium]
MKVDELQIRKGKSLNPKDWHCYEVQYDRICCPVLWEPEKQNNFLFFTQLNDSDTNTFFVVLRHDEELNNITLDNYLREAYIQLKDDTNEIFKEYSLRELVFENKKSFYGEFTTDIRDSLFLSLAMYTEVKGIIYDITLKIPAKEREVYYELFQDILFNYKINEHFLFSEREEINSIHPIDLSTF